MLTPNEKEQINNLSYLPPMLILEEIGYKVLRVGHYREDGSEWSVSPVVYGGKNEGQICFIVVETPFDPAIEQWEDEGGR